MRKIYVLAISAAFAVSAQAQTLQTSSIRDAKVSSAPYFIHSNEYLPQVPNNYDKFGPVSFYIDYSAYNTDDNIMPVGETVTGGRYVVNNLFQVADSNLQDISVNLQPYIGFTDYSNIAGSLVFVTTTDPGATVIVDSLFVEFGHQNSSGNDNKIRFQIRTGTNGNFGSAGTFTIPNGTIYWADSIVTNQSLSPSGSPFGTNSSYLYTATPGITQPLANGDLTVRIIPDVNTADGDTFAVSGLRYAGSPAPDPVQYNSMGIFSDTPTSIFLLNLSWNIWTSVTYSSLASAENMEAQGFTLHSFMPNPANEQTTINFELNKNSDVAFSIVDMNGRTVKNVKLNGQQAGKNVYTLNTSDLATGIYNVVMHANNGIFTKKLSVVH